MTLDSILAPDDEIVGQMRVRRLLQALPGFGKVAAGRLMGELGVSEHSRIRQLEAAQHARLLAWSRTHG